MEESEEKSPLPEFVPPENMKAAIHRAAMLGKNHHEHAYQVGKLLSWIHAQVKIPNKGKHLRPEHVKGKGFMAFVAKHFWFSLHHAYEVMKYSRECDAAGYLVPYGPSEKARACIRNVNGAGASRLCVRRDIATYFPEAWGMRDSDIPVTLYDEKKTEAFRRVMAQGEDQRALVWLGIYLAGGLAKKNKAA
jgi:hypothetical protein